MDFKDGKVAIVGLGLLGTSLGLALKGKCFRTVWARRRESLQHAVETGACDRASDNLDEALADADLSVICLPVKTIISLVRENRHLFKGNSVVTDIGSVKRRIVEELEPALADLRVAFVGSHPMAGSEQSGAAAAKKDMYRNATVFITPTDRTSPRACEMVSDLWRMAGAHVVSISPDEHDRVVAASSHLVHVSAAALAKAVLGRKGLSKLLPIACAGGFRDSTRVAASSPEMWEEIIELNSDNLVSELAGLEDGLKSLRESLEKGDYASVSAFLGEAAQLRNKWKHPSDR